MPPPAAMSGSVSAYKLSSNIDVKRDIAVKNSAQIKGVANNLKVKDDVSKPIGVLILIFKPSLRNVRPRPE